MAESSKKTIGKIITAIPISKETKKSFEVRLSKLMGKAIFLKSSVDPSILGGLILRMDGLMVDASIQGKLRHLRNKISKESQYLSL